MSKNKNTHQQDRKKRKYFGTDGFRGEANVDLTSFEAYKVGRFLGWYFSQSFAREKWITSKPKIVIGKDTRRSSYMIEYSIVAGITASGADAYMLHVTTTPSVSFATRQDDFDCGIMVTASHNPFYDNGIKIVNRYGEKLDDRVTSLIESYLDNDLSALGVTESDLPLATKEKIGSIIDYSSGRNRYVAYLISLASHSYKDLKIGLDCANGSAWMIANALFTALGAKTYNIGVEPNGLNVNQDCGSTHVERLCDIVKKNHLDLAFAFDGDADRCLAVDEQGNVVDGDKILFILANRLKRLKTLKDDVVVSTVASNSGLAKSLEKTGVKNLQTEVGDRFVYQLMQEKGYLLGGEQSGHIIIKKYATTGDGLLTAIMLTEEVCDTKLSLNNLTKDFISFPQVLKNIKVKNKTLAVTDEEVLKVVKEIERKINGDGKVLLRASGTEPVVRIMIEAKSQALCLEYANKIETVIIDRGFAND